MLAIIPLITCLSFGALHLLGFWLIDQKAFKHDFSKFHLNMTNSVAGTGIVILLFLNIPMSTKMIAVGWKLLLLTITQYIWKKKTVPLWLVTIISIYGMGVVILIASHHMVITPKTIFVMTLAGLVLASAIFTMNMGHWYLNVPGLDIRHLKQATTVLLYLLGLRLLWNIAGFFVLKIPYLGETISLFEFLTHIDGFLLTVGIFFGTALPFCLLYFVFGTLKVKSTQSATGILYVIVACILMGDLSYKYYWIKYGLLL